MCTELVNTQAPSSGYSTYTKTMRQHREKILVVHIELRLYLQGVLGRALAPPAMARASR